MHACGHDMHMTCLLAYCELMISAREHWSGTLVLVFQPAEERGTGAQAMVDDGLYSPTRHAVPIPDVVFSGHVVPARTGHASMPEKLIDPIVMAASAVMRLQTLVSREVHPSEHAVVTVASFISGGKAENVVGDEAVIAVDIRANTQETRSRLGEGVRRVVEAESIASRAVKPPTIEQTRSFPVTVNDPAVTARVGKAFKLHFGAGEDSYVEDFLRLSFSEDFCILADAVGKPALLFAYGCTEPDKFDQAKREGMVDERIPGNHSALFAPAIFPTMQVGVDAYALSALAWLAGKRESDGEV
ncbi:hippurate hydrolase protein [Rutstroemia sp. NJR-2017a BBW]|nr:hippurate hydrolase protein [Rutstroemia sp. NJR-2017a BBW]